LELNGKLLGKDGPTDNCGALCREDRMAFKATPNKCAGLEAPVSVCSGPCKARDQEELDCI